MDFLDLKNKSGKELQALLAEQREELRELRFKASEKQLKNIRKIRTVKKDIARLITLINAKKQYGKDKK